MPASVARPSMPASVPRSAPTSTPAATDGAIELGWPLGKKLAAAAAVAALLPALWWLWGLGSGSPGSRPLLPSATRTAVAPVPARTAEPTGSAPPPMDTSATEPDDAVAVYDDVRRETLRLLNERKLKEAEASARKLIELRPDDALGYRCLGSTLQDQGRVDEAKAVYSDCVTDATKGDVLECSQLGGVPQKR